MEIYATIRFAARGACSRGKLGAAARLFVTAARVLAPLAVLLTAAACERYVAIAPARYPDIDTVTTEKWRVETMDRTYRVRKIAATDSTLVLEKFESTETKTSERYPMRPERVANPGAPFAIRYEEIVRLERIDSDYTTVFVAGGAAFAILLAVFFTSASAH
jgi:hypothetical protein